MKKFLLLWAAAVGPTVLFAKDAVVEKSRGDVMVRTAGASSDYKARNGDRIFRGDQVRTGAGALVHLLFPDGTAVLVKENATLTVDQKKDGPQLTFELGEFLIGLKQRLAAGKRLTVRTPAAVAAVRGTLFWGKTDEAKASHYACFESAIEVSAQGKSVVLEPGQKITVAMGQAPGDVQSAADIPADYVNTFALEGSLQGLDALMPTPAPETAPAPTQPEPAPAAPEETPAEDGAAADEIEAEEPPPQ